MKILLLTDRMDRGGVETHVELLARSLALSGDEVTLLSFGGELADRLRAEGISCPLMPPPSHSLFSFLARRRILISLLKKERFDVLHAHTRLTALLLSSLGKRARRGAARAVTVHAQFSSTPLLRFLSYWGDRTVAVSEDLADYTARAFRVARGGITVIQNGIDLDRFARDESMQAAPHSILFASRLDADCSLGAELLLSLIPTLLSHRESLSLTVAGGGDAYEKLSLRADRINRAAGRRVVNVIGHASDMPTLLRQHEIFVGVSRAAMEAAACGCAVILCGNEGYLGTWCRENDEEAARTNLCCRASPPPTREALLRDLLSLLDAPERLQRAREEAWLLSRRYGRERMLASHRSLYRSLSRGVRTVCIGGYFGCSNLGDDLILSGFCSHVQKNHPEIRVIALSGNPKLTEKTHGVRSVSRRSPYAILRALTLSDAFLCGGGSLLQNKTGRLSLVYYLSLLRLSRLLSARPILYAAGFGPVTGKRAQRATRRTLKSLPYLSLRDAVSHAALLRMNLPATRLHLTADAAFLLAPRHPFAPLPKKYGILVFKGDTPSPFLMAVARELRSIGFSLSLMVLDRRMDTSAATAAATQLSLPVLVPTSAAEALHCLSDASVLLSERLHALILAVMSGTPAVGYLRDASDEKIPAFAKSAKLPCFLEGACESGEVVRTLIAEADASGERRKSFFSLAQSARKKAEKDLAKIFELLYNEE